MWHLPKPGMFGNAGGEKRQDLEKGDQGRQDLVRGDQGRQAGVRPHRALKPRSGSYLQAGGKKPPGAVQWRLGAWLGLRTQAGGCCAEAGRGPRGSRGSSPDPTPYPLRPSGGDFPPLSASLHEGNARSGLSGPQQVPRAACELSTGGSGCCGQKSRAGRPHGPGAPFASLCSAHRRVQESAEAGRGAALAWPAEAL